MKKAIIAMTIPMAVLFFYACKKDTSTSTPTPIVTGPTQLAAALTSQTTTGPTTGTGAFTGNVNKTTGALSYTVTYSGINATAVTLDPVSTSATSGTGTAAFSRSVLLAGSFPTISTTPGSGTTTTPGSGTTTTPGSGTTTTPGSGTTTTPGSGTTTTPGSGTTTTPGSGTTGTGVTISSPLTGTTTLSTSRADSVSRGLYKVNIRTAANPNGEIGGTIQPR